MSNLQYSKPIRELLQLLEDMYIPKMNNQSPRSTIVIQKLGVVVLLFCLPSMKEHMLLEKEVKMGYSKIKAQEMEGVIQITTTSLVQ
jgi:hypothetical protein